ncbi:MGMT family protein [Portibacter lacus]|uniref:Methylated-DNA--protein-cysteine methyltransferase n=1 Tax=Portibacter lacus TaxID=1099794 RepID=A0AA37SSY8_9BACT|nr:MGMT family protein [Portibacter lacus]GLR18994.1 methylated-DNA--protein-cysteine methyltransferase [Portibacter lacus]
MKRPHYFEQVLETARLIPEGRVSTYGAIADFLALGSARMVGWAMKNSFNSEELVPAHRVVNGKGELSGRNAFEHPDLMAELLISEGVEVKNNKVVRFSEVFWHPREMYE